MILKTILSVHGKLEMHTHLSFYSENLSAQILDRLLKLQPVSDKIIFMDDIPPPANYEI